MPAVPRLHLLQVDHVPDHPLACGLVLALPQPGHCIFRVQRHLPHTHRCFLFPLILSKSKFSFPRHVFPSVCPLQFATQVPYPDPPPRPFSPPSSHLDPSLHPQRPYRHFRHQATLCFPPPFFFRWRGLHYGISVLTECGTRTNGPATGQINLTVFGRFFGMWGWLGEGAGLRVFIFQGNHTGQMVKHFSFLLKSNFPM